MASVQIYLPNKPLDLREDKQSGVRYAGMVSLTLLHTKVYISHIDSIEAQLKQSRIGQSIIYLIVEFGCFWSHHCLLIWI